MSPTHLATSQDVRHPSEVAPVPSTDWQASALALRWAAQEVDPLAAALQAQLGAETRAAYRKDWRTFAAWLSTRAPGIDTATDLGIHQALVGWMQLGDKPARALLTQWIADQKRQGLSANTVNRRLASLRWAARQAEAQGVAEVKLHLVRGLKPGPGRRDMRGPSGLADLRALLVEAERVALRPGCGGAPGAARNRAVASLLLLNGLRRGEVARIAMGDWDQANPAELAIRGKGREERETVTLAEPTSAALAAWLKLRPAWAPTEPWAPMFTALDAGVQKRKAGRFDAEVAAALALLEADGAAPGSPPWMEALGQASASWSFSGAAVYSLVRTIGAEALEGRVVSPHRLRHSAVTTAVKDLGLTMSEAQSFARHKSVATTTAYFDAAGEQQAKVTGALSAFLTPTLTPSDGSAA